MHLGDIPSILFLISGFRVQPQHTHVQECDIKPHSETALAELLTAEQMGWTKKTKQGKKEKKAATGAKLPEGACLYKWHLPIKQQGIYMEKT